MAQEITNFGRFYTAIRALSVVGDRDDFKRQTVWQYTDGRTDSLREMTRQEYDRCCEDLEGQSRYKEELRKERSATLRLMQKAGIDTTDWNRVNKFCLDPRHRPQGRIRHRSREKRGPGGGGRPGEGQTADRPRGHRNAEART